jgi:hypothetical protein
MKTTDKLTGQEFELGLKQFFGTTQYWEHFIPGAFRLRLTDGCNFVRQEAGAFWLFDMIASYQYDERIKLYPFQIWQLTRKEDHWSLECRRDDGQHMLTSRISYSDFPIDHIEIWVLDGIALLPSEY